MTSEIIEENDLIFLILDDRRRWILPVKSGDTFHTHKGIIEFDDIIGQKFGTVVFSKPYETQGYKFFVLKPLISDYVIHMIRKTQIIYPEDAGMIILYSGIEPGSKVIEAGCGSGALTCILGNYVRPHGHIYSYDIREKSIKRAKKNIERAKLNDIVSIKFGNIINDDLNCTNVDSVVLDIAEPWNAIKKVKSYLKQSGTIVSFSPTIEQVKKTTFALREHRFIEIVTYELIKRKIQVKKNATRPEVRMIGHTGYLTFGRKIQDLKNPYRERKPESKEIVSFNGMPLRS
ncbi:MAG: tRNA (adenine-N1)-methyltransferase [Candidatus Lokiarchaeota archaeon]|jgi:tRNA (adenine57-N1/adenine58-N1)-methyltransferase|nr:tRNA (adenine-N1)-methyltransferase [Candidatus Lokiarchaeota archaeon]